MSALKLIRRMLGMGCVSVVLVAQAQTYYPPPQGSDGGKGIFLTMLVGAVQTQFVQSFAQGAGCVFGNLLGFMGAQANYNCKNGQNMAAYPPNTGFAPGGMMPNGQPGYPQNQPGLMPNPMPANSAVLANQTAVPQQVSASPAIPAEDAARLARQPVLAVMFEKLASNMPNATVVDTHLAKIELGKSEPEFTIKTGEVFAVKFSTSVPGRVRLFNTDVDGQTAQSNLYEAIPGGDNRMPRDFEGGIQMVGKPGMEYLEILFTPCVSLALQNHPSVQGFASVLPACSPEVATKQYVPALPNGAGGLAVTGAKVMQFTMSPDQTQPVAFAAPDSAKGESHRFRIRVNHEGGKF